MTIWQLHNKYIGKPFDETDEYSLFISCTHLDNEKLFKCLFCIQKNIQNFIEWFEMLFLWIFVTVHIRSLGTMTQNHCETQLRGPNCIVLAVYNQTLKLGNYHYSC